MQDIIDAISDILVAKYPDIYIYDSYQPEGFNRPSFFIELIQETRTDENYNTTAGKIAVQITYFAPVDERHNCDTEKQYSTYEEVMDLFPHSIKVGSRYYYLDQISGGLTNNEVVFTLNFTRRSSRPQGNPAKPATTIHIDLQEA